MIERKLTITFAPAFENVDMVRAAITGICRVMYGSPSSESLIGDFTLAVTEAMNNAVEHSKSELINVELSADELGIVFKVSTNGKKFDPTVNAAMPSVDNNSGFREGGYGLAIIKEMVDSIKYEYLDGKSVLTLSKTLKKIK